MEINEHEVYTLQEAQIILKISPSTSMRMIKKGLIRAAKIGKQYRILGKEILRLVSPELEDTMGKLYNKGRHWLHEDEELYQEFKRADKIKEEPSVKSSVEIKEHSPVAS